MNASVRDLKTHLSAYLRRVKEGERVFVLEHGIPFAVILAFRPLTAEPQAHILANNPNITWNGKRFVPPSEGVKIGGRSMAEMMVEDRG